mmetsp:Transcript_19457/g.40013  ORF Transcript_19457/g.40013 Transcript_19457/m.40013 type:complete len:173 (+) Transcript_19457:147-665(+)|eukprot:CAMPEP_0197280632 /NCGR_PEP_ID=MMETSP1432-20130617/21723_1 /TAXON_ID=44447 /ORGANISM="Pseudo-nitzschia delicatissima, Strain UNC1205" /LENGTH=172 /DNA_ID=CAMNT_0042747345 /DNA_START=117 /DNA_END=635 /DNA_ORIENTATION=+
MVSTIGMAFMVASNAVAWHEILAQSSSSLSELRSVVCKIALFYTLWALYNRYPAGRKQELGHYSFSLLTAACLENPLDSMNTKIALFLSVGLVLINFAGVLPLMSSMGGVKSFAKKIHRSDSKIVIVWGYIFAAYIVSNTALWSYCSYLFYKKPLLATVASNETVETEPNDL